MSEVASHLVDAIRDGCTDRAGVTPAPAQ